ncbi:MAG: hypothetical protein PHU23_12660, partial [Dehalococcoidales bacterium]|nr:hypothetical protein [Dehalococcoidales bacterium]
MKNTKPHLVSKVVCLTCLLLLVALLGSTIACSKAAPTTAASPVVTSTQPVSQPIKIVFSFFEPPSSSVWTDLYKPMFDEIETRTNGKVKIEPHLNAELVSLADTVDAVLKGTVDMAHTMPMMSAGQFPMDDISTLWSY